MRAGAGRSLLGDERAAVGPVVSFGIGQIADGVARIRVAREKVEFNDTNDTNAAGVPLDQVADTVGHTGGSRVTETVYKHQITQSVSAAKTPMEKLFGESAG
jgi:hypothetical protein